jgi:hypothetical protein
VYGGATKELQELAVRCLGCVSGAAAAERGHKEMNFLHSKLRNRLLWGTVETLMYVRMNLPLVYPNLDFSSANAKEVLFKLPDDEDEEEEPLALPSEWQVAVVLPPDADELREAVTRSRSRAATLRRAKPLAAQFAPVPNPSVDAPAVNDGVDRGAGRRTVKRPREWRDY